jgi:hypothetical protein
LTAVVTSERVGELGAPRGARVRAAVGLVYIGVAAGLGLWRAASFENIVRAGEAAAALASMLCVLCLAVAVLVIVVRSARLSVDERGVTWGFRGFSFHVPRARIKVARLYRDAVAVVPQRGFPWYLSARDYTPFAQLVAGFRRSGVTLEERSERRAPLRARLQAYGMALDVLLALDAVGATFLLLFS